MESDIPRARLSQICLFKEISELPITMEIREAIKQTRKKQEVSCLLDMHAFSGYLVLQC